MQRGYGGKYVWHVELCTLKFLNEATHIRATLKHHAETLAMYLQLDWEMCASKYIHSNARCTTRARGKERERPCLEVTIRRLLYKRVFTGCKHVTAPCMLLLDVFYGGSSLVSWREKTRHAPPLLICTPKPSSPSSFHEMTPPSLACDTTQTRGPSCWCSCFLRSASNRRTNFPVNGVRSVHLPPVGKRSIYEGGIVLLCGRGPTAGVRCQQEASAGECGLFI